jgi:hypothetical protein
MIEPVEYNQLTSYFNEFNRRNRWRPTRLVVFAERAEQEMERGMPLVGISLEADGEGRARIHIMLGDHEARNLRRQTYTITGVKRVTPRRGHDGLDETLEIEDEQGEMNLLHFEPLPVTSQLM